MALNNVLGREAGAPHTCASEAAAGHHLWDSHLYRIVRRHI